MKKRIITLVTLVLFLVGMTSNVFAAGDYRNNPDNPKPTTPTVTAKPTAKPTVTATPATEKEAAVKEAQETIKNAETGTLPSGEAGKIITIENAAKLPATLIEEAIKSETPVVFMNKDKTVAIQFTGLTVSADQLRDLSTVMNVATDAAAKEKFIATLDAATQEKMATYAENSVFIQPEAQGEFGVSMIISIKQVEKPADAAYENPFLYYVHDDGTIENYGIVESGDGWSKAVINHSSSYMVSYNLIEDAVVDTESANYKANKANGVDVDTILNIEAKDEATAAPEASAAPETTAPATDNNSTMLFVGGIALVAVIVVIVVMSKRKKDTTDPTNKPKA
ncbi:MAG: hypothetical protein RR643_07120 [Anaerorhabdus sp.]|uniref:hypothetical protein n=2 Tax=Anaerorhabdus sp. TaxID=1872524 RepID=UPI002FCB0E38